MAEDDSPKEACGLFGVFNHENAGHMVYQGLYALQHRGEESAGIVSYDESGRHTEKGMGLVGEVFSVERLQRLKGDLAMGHTRYSTTGSSLPKNVQPIVVNCSKGQVAIAHNGNLVNAPELRDGLEDQGAIFQTTTDSEIIVHLIARSMHPSFEDSLLEAVVQLEGAFSLLLLMPDMLVGIRDPHGWRPLVLGKLEDAYILASETCALELLGARCERELEPGEVLIITKDGFQSHFPFEKVARSSCIFEHVYFARPDSVVFGQSVHEARVRMGRHLAREYPAEADVVVAIPDSGNAAALGYSLESGIPFDMGIIRNHYIGRTFIQPTTDGRSFKAKVKFNPVRRVLEGKRVVVIDDSIVRGTTCASRMASLRAAGAEEIHLRISCPPVRYSCYYGIDFPNQEELIAHRKSVDEIAEYLGVQSLGYLSLKGLIRAVGSDGNGYCTACYSGEYPIPVKQLDKFRAEKRIKRTGEVKRAGS
ncbi:MAG: amidophosphoribosyltransferase [Candidatus Omnitrophica bacterium]|nr:amidophosphoribosyltransferase [Candidatus Omnitrophota bacterium]